MKRSHDHTQLTRLAAISLVVVMCLSALPMLAPSAAASGSDTYVWTAAGDGHYGDATNPNGEANQALVARITGDGTQRHFDNGDLVQSPTSIDQYEAIKSIYDTGLDSVPYHISKGNHDNAEWLMDTFGMDRNQYTVVDGDYAWIVLRSSQMTAYMNPYSHKYLEEQLDLLRDKLVFVVAHVPQRILQPAVSPSSVDNPYFINVIQSHAYHIGAVIFSHTHVADYQYIDGVPWVTTGTYGKTDRGSYVLFEISSSGREHVITIRDQGIDPEDNDRMFSPKTHTVTIPEVTIVPPTSIVTYVWDGEGADNKASTAANWYCVDGGVINNDVLPTSGSAILFNEESAENCTWDLATSPYGILIDRGYTGKITQELAIQIGMGGYQQFGGEFTQYAPVTVLGDTVVDGGLLVGQRNHTWTAAGDFYCASSTISRNQLNLLMSGEDSILWCGGGIKLNSLRVTGDVTFRLSVLKDHPGDYLSLSSLDVSGELTLDSLINVRRYGGATYHNSGVIDGEGELQLILYTSDGHLPESLGDVRCPVVVASSFDAKQAVTMTAAGDIDIDAPLIVRAHGDQTITLDLGSYDVSTTAIVVGPMGVILGSNSEIITTVWDSSAGTWTPGDSTVVLRDGGSAVLAPGQSFNRLEIASDDGRSASWSMTATGAQAPIVTGLRSGSYLWYLDGVEQGVIEAGEDGTIALSYESTGLHTLSVEPTSMTAAMDGMAAAVGIVAVLAVLGGLFTMIGKAFGRLKF